MNKLKYRVNEMTGISQKYLSEVMNEVATALQLNEWSFDKQSFVDIAQNYFGVIIPVNLSGEISGKREDFSIVLKLAPTDERYRVSGAVTIMFGKEIFVYSKILNRYRELLKDLKVTIDYTIPNCYYKCSDYCKEVIAMQNMCEKGYRPYVKSMFLDLNHITVALKSLAQFHALSFILRERENNMYEEAREFCIPLSEKTNNRFIDILRDRLQKAMDKFKETPYVPLLKTLENKCSKFIELTANSVKSSCLCHGDIWKENLLFKYEENLPVSVCIIDYQTTRICSPAFDLLYLIVTSTTNVLRKEYFHQLLDTYYQTFKQNLCRANLNPNYIYSKDMFDYDLQMVGPACLIIANTAIWLSSGLQQEGHIRSKIVLSTDAEKLQAVNKYISRVKSIIDDLGDYGLIKIV